jgi:transmembrane sensor
VSVVLADGSRVELDSSSDLSVRYSSNARELSLTRGQARFRVAHDAERPFSVMAGSRRVVATGTDFDVDLLGGSLYVTLLEGRVLVLPSGQSGAGIRTGQLEAGEQLTVSPDGTTRVVPANLDRVTAWQSRQIILDDEPLASAIERINRYSKDRLVLGDGAVGALRISGVFRTGNLAGFVETLTHYLPVDSERRRDVILLRTRPQNTAPPADRREQAARRDPVHSG